ncbi:MAG TPA: hypothetical protein DFK12_09265 [Gallionellaceae bacterium]|nr:hypothetical protein [Gallionellaceae bacterium]
MSITILAIDLMVFFAHFLSLQFRKTSFFHPRKTRKSRNQSIGYHSVASHPIGVTIYCGIYLNMFVFFVDNWVF